MAQSNGIRGRAAGASAGPAATPRLRANCGRSGRAAYGKWRHNGVATSGYAPNDADADTAPGQAAAQRT